MSGNELRIENLSLKREGLDILHRVNLAVRPGEIHGLLGLNGSGKSSLAYAIMGCAGYTPDEGRIWFAGQDISCHATQWSASPMMRAPVEKQRLFFGTEHFARAAARRPDQDFVNELLAGVV